MKGINNMTKTLVNLKELNSKNVQLKPLIQWDINELIAKSENEDPKINHLYQLHELVHFYTVEELRIETVGNRYQRETEQKHIHLFYNGIDGLYYLGESTSEMAVMQMAWDLINSK